MRGFRDGVKKLNNNFKYILYQSQHARTKSNKFAGSYLSYYQLRDRTAKVLKAYGEHIAKKEILLREGWDMERLAEKISQVSFPGSRELSILGAEIAGYCGGNREYPAPLFLV